MDRCHVCHAVSEVLFYGTAYIIAIISPYLFMATWVVAIVTAKFVVAEQKRTAAHYLRSLLIGCPIGVLSAMVGVEYGFQRFTAAAIGCAAAVLAEKLLDQDIQARVISIILDKFKTK